ncbi:hypothetical protein CDAR_526821 [Caerostris darwini]|uniref:Uncharacterized protein n=1 Tax=Caerostris darwini TaxID=1538125 RepID=A0AAV4Q334_9ARAC|nr:hypothetical protein CDAR_526821 [Caerostris darwini]
MQMFYSRALIIFLVAAVVNIQAVLSLNYDAASSAKADRGGLFKSGRRIPSKNIMSSQQVALRSFTSLYSSDAEWQRWMAARYPGNHSAFLTSCALGIFRHF